MPFDPVIADQFSAIIISNAQGSSQLTNVVDRNLTQGLGVVNTSIIHQQGAVSDDAGLIASLQTASRTPAQGANDKIA